MRLITSKYGTRALRAHTPQVPYRATWIYAVNDLYLHVQLYKAILAHEQKAHA